MADYDKEEVMTTQSNALLPLVSPTVVNKQADQTGNDSSASSKSELANSERLLASLRIDVEPQSLGHLGILDLADELLMNMFEHAADSADIRNIRLTCRRFCSTSSHLLLDCLDVCLTAASLARAQEISYHPPISKGIRVLHISLNTHDCLFDFSNFTSLAIENLRAGIGLRLLGSWCQYKKTRKYSTHQQSLDVEVLRRGYEKYRVAMMLLIGASLVPTVRPTELTVQVPLAIHSAGFSTIEIGIELPIQPGGSEWIHDQAQLLGLKAAAESLEAFTFQLCWWKSSPPEDLSSASPYLRVVLGAANLQVLTLSVPSMFLFDEHVGSLLASLRWPHLREINLVRIASHLSDLKTFVEGFRPGILLNLKQVRLRSGSWAEGLDVLRSKAKPESQVGSLSGAECDSMAFDQLRRILGGWQASWASQYVQGASIRNPFLVTEDETADEGTNAGSI
ncbi:hypothetical protein LA080_003679 [Diaporthe eres]|nr:hypothetical protein LA080_003679 [Diaporthe eres]